MRTQARACTCAHTQLQAAAPTAAVTERAVPLDGGLRLQLQQPVQHLQPSDDEACMHIWRGVARRGTAWLSAVRCSMHGCRIGRSMLLGGWMSIRAQTQARTIEAHMHARNTTQHNACNTMHGT